MLIIISKFLKMAKKTRYKKSVRQLYSGDESLSNLGTLWVHSGSSYCKALYVAVKGPPYRCPPG
jgi:hypothetical protein